MEWSEGSDRLSGERERLLRCLSCDRLEWSDAIEWISEMSDQTRAMVQPLSLDTCTHTDKSDFKLRCYTTLTISVRGVG